MMSIEKDTAQTKRAIGAVLRRRRKEKSLSQRELAQQIGTSPAVVSAWELGKSEPSNRNLRKVVQALELSLEEFFTEANVEMGDVTPGSGEGPRPRMTPVPSVAGSTSRELDALADHVRRCFREMLDHVDPKRRKAIVQHLKRQISLLADLAKAASAEASRVDASSGGSG